MRRASRGAPGPTSVASCRPTISTRASASAGMSTGVVLVIVKRAGALQRDSRGHGDHGVRPGGALRDERGRGEPGQQQECGRGTDAGRAAGCRTQGRGRGGRHAGFYSGQGKLRPMFARPPALDWRGMSTTPTIRVLAAVIHRDGCYLLALRPAGKRHAGCWEFPGGKVEPGESDIEAMARELREELGVELVALGRTRAVRRDGDSAFEITFLDVTVEGEPQALEHEALAWVRPEEFAGYVMAGSDRWCAECLAEDGEQG